MRCPCSSQIWCAGVRYLSFSRDTVSESCIRRLRRTAPCGPPVMTTQARPACHRCYLYSPSPAGSPSSCPLHILYLFNLKLVIGIPNRCFILELRANQFSQEKLNKIIRNTQLPFCCARDKDSTTIRLLSIRSNGRDHDSA